MSRNNLISPPQILSKINAPETNKKERLLKIQQKLEAITAFKQNQAKDELQEELTRRIVTLEQKCTEEVKNLQAKTRKMREELSEMRVKQAEMTKKCQLSKRLRATQIINLQKQVISLMNFEAKERKQIESSIIALMEQKLGKMAKELANLKELRVEELNRFETSIQNCLPELHLLITNSSNQIETRLEQLHQQAKKTHICNEEKQRECGFKNVINFIASVVDDIRAEISMEKQVREINRERLTSLFQNAYGKLKLSV